MRQELGARIDELVGQLTGLKTFLLSVDGAPAGGFVPPPRAVPEAAPTLVGGLAVLHGGVRGRSDRTVVHSVFRQTALFC